MSNNVTVTAAFGAGAEGHYLFAATGTMMSDAFIAIVTPVVQGSLDASGNISAVLLASDNFGAGELLWNIYLEVRGLNFVNFNDFPVNFASGASQNLFTILNTAGWIPTPS